MFGDFYEFKILHFNKEYQYYCVNLIALIIDKTVNVSFSYAKLLTVIEIIKTYTCIVF